MDLDIPVMCASVRQIDIATLIAEADMAALAASPGRQDQLLWPR
jgi:hypothetical protein